MPDYNDFEDEIPDATLIEFDELDDGEYDDDWSSDSWLSMDSDSDYEQEAERNMIPTGTSKFTSENLKLSGRSLLCLAPHVARNSNCVLELGMRFNISADQLNGERTRGFREL
ncbi:hypothetical protein MRX96_027664 [Rhipicephalus microplus]